MQRADSLEKTLILGKTEGRRRGQQRIICLDSIPDSMDMTLSKLRDTVRRTWCSIVHWGPKSRTWFSDWTTATYSNRYRYKCRCKRRFMISSCFMRLCQLKVNSVSHSVMSNTFQPHELDPMNSTSWAHQSPLSMGFSRQEYWSRLPFPSPGCLPKPGMEPGSPASQADSLPSKPLWQLRCSTICRLRAGEPGKPVACFNPSPKSWEAMGCWFKSRGLKVCEQVLPCLGVSVTFQLKTRDRTALPSPFCSTWRPAG